MKMRTSQPKNNKYYIRTVSGGYNRAVAGYPTIAGADVLCNCVGYANGRFNEIGKYGRCKYQLVCNAENFIELAKKMGLKVSKTPTLGGIMVWQKGETLKDDDGAGHVAVVEKIVSSTQIVTSESGYSSYAFKNFTRKKGKGNWGQPDAYKFRGCIINPAVKTQADRAKKISDTAKKYCWPADTPKKKYDGHYGKPLPRYKREWKKLRGTNPNTGCHSFVSFVLQKSGYGKMPISGGWPAHLKWLQNHGFRKIKPKYENGKIKRDQFKAGDVVYWAKSDGSHHIYIIVRDDKKRRRAESVQHGRPDRIGDKWPHIGKGLNTDKHKVDYIFRTK